MFKWSVVYIYLFCYAFSPVNIIDINNHVRHPLYVTVTQIDHNAKDKTLEISCKIFTNDFEGAIKKTLKTEIDLSSEKDKPLAGKLINEYIARHLQIKVDGKPVVLQFVGSEKEKETEATWSYFQVNNVPSVNKLIITNTLLYESFDNEINLIHVTVSGNRKSTKLSNPDSTAEFDF